MNTVNQVTFRAYDYEQSKEFYCKHLKMEIVREFIKEDTNERFVFLKYKSETLIELIFTGMKVEYPSEISIGFKVDDYESLYELLKIKNYEVSSKISPSKDVEFFFVKDPNGVNIQIMK